jgi:hypothetical protein
MPRVTVDGTTINYSTFGDPGRRRVPVVLVHAFPLNSQMWGPQVEDLADRPAVSSTFGLVTDVGGVLAHGSIVAREFGIPAVLGTGEASQRIRHGQRLTVDGDQGLVLLGAHNISQTV